MGDLRPMTNNAFVNYPDGPIIWTKMALPRNGPTLILHNCIWFQQEIVL